MGLPKMFGLHAPQIQVPPHRVPEDARIKSWEFMNPYMEAFFNY